RQQAETRRIRIQLRVACGSYGGGARDAGFALERAAVQPPPAEASGTAPPVLRAKLAYPLPIQCVVDRIALDKVAANVEFLQRSYEVANGAAAQLPDPACRCPAIATT